MKLGEKQTLYIVKKVEFGVYLAQEHNDVENRVLLPARQVPSGAAIGDQLEVFLYKDSKDRWIATTNMLPGDSVTAIIPYTSGYGISGSNSVLPYSTLIFQIKLDKILSYDKR